ncbi:MAG: phage tail protein [Xanthobacteraceae bacterium]
MPLFTAIGAALFGAGTFLAGATAFALQMAAGVGLNLIAAAIKGKPTQEKVGIQGKLAGGGDVPRSLILGEYNTAGSLVYRNTWGQNGETPNAYYVEVRALGDLPDGGNVDVWVDGEKVTLVAGTYGLTSTKHIKYGTKWGDLQHLWFQFYDGAQTAADSRLVSWFGGSVRPWGSDRIGNGVPYVIITALRDDLETENPLFNGFPNCKFTRGSVPLYDPSKDNTVGGSGSHRYDDPSTWGGDGDNLPAVQIYNILRGFTYNGQWLYGLQTANPAILPPASWIAAINKCRALVDGPDGPEAQYRAGIQINVNVAPADAIEALLKTCNGRLTEVGGVYTIHVGEPDTPVLSFSDADILSTEEQIYNPFRTLADSINGVVAKYPEPLEGWNVKTSPATKNPAQIIRDGSRELFADVDLSACPYHGQVQRLLKSSMLEALRERRHTIVLPPWAQVLEPGDIVQWSSERNGYEEKWFRIDGMAYKANLDVILQITEVDPSDYDWHQDADYVPPVFAPMEIIRPAPQPIVSFDAEGIIEYDELGFPRRGGALLTWDGSKTDITGVSYEIATAADDADIVLRERTDDAQRGAIKVWSQVFVPGRGYFARGRYIPSSPRDTTFSDWRPFIVPDVKYGLADFQNALNEKWTTALAQVTEAMKSMMQQIDEMTSLAALQDWVAHESTQSNLVATDGRLSASITEVRAVAVGVDQSLAAYKLLVNARLDDPSTGLAANASATQALTTAVNSPTTGLPSKASAAALTDVSTTVNSHTASISQFMSSVDGTSVTGAWLMSLDGAPGGGIILEGFKANGVTTYNVMINGNVIMPGSVTVGALNVGTLFSISNHFGSATVDGMFTSSNGKMIQSWSDAYLEVYD